MYFLFYFLCFVLQTVFLFICLIENSCLGDQTGESLLNINTAENYGKKAIKNTKSSGSLPPGKTVIVFMPRGKLTGRKKKQIFVFIRFDRDQINWNFISDVRSMMLQSPRSGGRHSVEAKRYQWLSDVTSPRQASEAVLRLTSCNITTCAKLYLVTKDNLQRQVNVNPLKDREKNNNK